jgi:hypothetical protein
MDNNENSTNQGISVEQVQEFFNTDEGKSMLDSIKDKHFAKALDTWKTNNLPKIKEQWEAEHSNLSPEQQQLKDLQNKIASMEQEKNYETLKNKALTYANDNHIPVNGIIDMFVGKDEESTKANLNKLNEIFNTSVQAAVEERLKSSSYVPPMQNGNVSHAQSLYDALKENYKI